MIAQIPEKYELTICYSWSKCFQGMSGHLFEMIEYYSILKDHFSVCMMICEDMPWERIERTIRDKYDFTEEEIEDIRNNLLFYNHPKVVKGKNLFVVDGNFNNLSDKFLYFDNIFGFACADLTYQTMDNVTILHDNRVYGEFNNTINYVKKILLDRYRPIEGECVGVNLIYATKNARGLAESYYFVLEDTYQGDFLLLTNTDIESELSDRFMVEEMPVKDLFNRFSTYLYTPVGKKWDCSPRFIVECKFYGKEVIYHDIDYWDEDKGLCWRVCDIENDWESLFLKPDDDIINILKGLL